MPDQITYTSGYKYQLKETYVIDLKPYTKRPINPPQKIVTEYLELDTNGELTIKEGYAWDGPSGPTIDTKTFMRGSLVHDALYQLMREAHLPQHNRDEADDILEAICRKDGMSPLRAFWVHRAVDWFGDVAASPQSIKTPIKAP